jgi:bifunctional DNA-binding transcriptional regulator/antitoxin component of YhaV-PrlF toxin-antitoxin module
MQERANFEVSADWMEYSSVDEKGRTRIPRFVRKALGLKGPTRVVFRLVPQGDGLVVRLESAGPMSTTDPEKALRALDRLRESIAAEMEGSGPIDAMEGVRDE